MAFSASADEVRVAVASNFLAPLKALQSDFERTSGHRLSLSAGSSGKLFAQIRHGAPFDVFLSADADKPAELLRLGLAVEGSQFTYAVGRLALWAPGYPQAVGPRVLDEGQLKRVAMANPKLAPYGAAAQQTLAALAITPTWTPITGENIAQVYQFVASGNADAGWVAWSQWVAGPNADPSTVWQVPASLHDPIRQDAVLLTRAQHSAAAQAFLDYLKSQPARGLLSEFGYEAAP